MTIGDVDEFGFTPTTGLVSAQGGPADTDGDGTIEPGEYLPDLNRERCVAWSKGDNLDNRSASEAAVTSGRAWTAVALSKNYGKGLADDASFNFAVPTAGDADYGVDHYINFVFGDYDVTWDSRPRFGGAGCLFPFTRATPQFLYSTGSMGWPQQ